jgi:AraC-like DNA-binding protein
MPVTIKSFDFLSRKYGSELLVDIGRMEALPNFELSRDPHYLNFYEIILVTEGSGHVFVDEERIPLTPHMAIFTSPRQIRKWDYVQPPKGYALFFDGDFIHAFFSDALFLYRFQFFHNYHYPHYIRLEDELFRQTRDLFTQFDKEIHHLDSDSNHVLRALLYLTLIRFKRQYDEKYNLSGGLGDEQKLFTFRLLIEQHFQRYNRVAEYARILNISAAHLNELAKAHTGFKASELIRQRIVQEAKRLLRHSALPVSEIASKLGFSEPGNFSRFFYQHTSCSPVQYRNG